MRQHAICPHCQQTIKAPRKPKGPELIHGDTSQMTDAEVFAYYKRTAPLEDLRFMLRNARMSERLRGACLALEAAATVTTVSPAAFKAQYLRLQAEWRIERNAADLADHIANGDRYDPTLARWEQVEHEMEMTA